MIWKSGLNCNWVIDLGCGLGLLAGSELSDNASFPRKWAVKVGRYGERA
jgi:predicted TPR repeat methyltransferase